MSKVNYSSFISYNRSLVVRNTNFGAIANLAMSALKDALFLSCVIIQKELYNDDSIFEQFINYSYENKIALDWRLHLYFARWLEINNKLTKEIAIECACASASQWTYYDKSPTKHMLIKSKLLNNSLIISTKVINPILERTIEIYEINPVANDYLFEYQACDDLDEIYTKGFTIL